MSFKYKKVAATKGGSKFKSLAEQKRFIDFLKTHLLNILSAGDLGLYEYRNLEWLEGHSASAMEIEVDHQYYEITIKVNPEYAAEKWANKDYHDLVRCICHEVAHIPSSELAENLHFTSSTYEKSYYFERNTELTSRWLHNYYTKSYMPNWKIRLDTGQIKKR